MIDTLTPRGFRATTESKRERDGNKANWIFKILIKLRKIKQLQTIRKITEILVKNKKKEKKGKDEDKKKEKERKGKDEN